MNLDRRTIEKIIAIGSLFILLYLGLQNMNVVVSFFSWLLYVLMPFIIAVCCTFFLNVPLKSIEKVLFRPKGDKPVHPLLMEYLLKAIGFSDVQILWPDHSLRQLPFIRSNSIENLWEVNNAIERVSGILFGSQDYAVVATK